MWARCVQMREDVTNVSNISASERRRFNCYVFSRWLKLCSDDLKQCQQNSGALDNLMLLTIFLSLFQEDENTPDADMGRVMKMNSPEWYLILIGCLAALLSGAVQPVFALIFSNILGVSDRGYCYERHAFFYCFVPVNWAFYWFGRGAELIRLHRVNILSPDALASCMILTNVRIGRFLFYTKRISTICVTSMWRNGIICRCIFMFLIKKIACKMLRTRILLLECCGWGIG